MVLVALCLTLVLGVVVAGYVAVCARTMELSNRSFCTMSSVQLAEIGMEEALWSLNQALNTTGYTWPGWNPPSGNTITKTLTGFATNIGIPGTVSITVDNYNTTDPFNTPPTITATATLTMPDGIPIQKQLKATVKPAALFSNAVGAVDLILNPSVCFASSSGGTTVDSYDSIPTAPNNGIYTSWPYADPSIVNRSHLAIIGGSNLNIQNAVILGYATTANPTGAISFTSGTVTSLTSTGDTSTSPAIDFSRISNNANQYAFDIVAPTGAGTTAINASDLISKTSGGQLGTSGSSTPSIYHVSGDLSLLSSTDNLIINGPVIIDVSGNLTIQGSARIVVKKGHSPDLDGSAQIYVAGSLNIGGGGGGGGSVYVTDSTNETIRRITPVGSPPPPAWVVTTLAGSGTSGSTDGTGTSARFNSPGGMAVDDAGNIYVADTNNHTIRKITPAGGVTTLAGSAGSAGSADGTGTAAQFSSPSGVAVDGTGNVNVADTNNHTIRQITPAGVVSTLAGSGTSGNMDGTGTGAQFSSPSGVAVDSSGNVYVTDKGNNTIRMITPTGVVSTLAGLAGSPGSTDGTGSAAQFNSPVGVAVDDAGNVYVADTGNDTIRKITPAGVVSTLAGSAGFAGSADGTGGAARFNSPGGVALDDAGNVYVADTGNDTIRKITPAGVVTTLAGAAGSLGSADGTGGAARFNGPTGLAVDCWGINNLTRRPRKLAIFWSGNSSDPGLTTANDLYGFYGAIYAPNSPLVVAGDPRIYGALVGQSVTFNGIPTIHYDLDLRRASFSVVNTPYDVAQWLVSN